MAITVEIYEEIRQCREKYGYGQRKTARLLKVSRNTVKKYWEGATDPWERKQGSGRKNDVLTDEHLKFIVSAKPPRGLNKRSKSDKLNPKGSEEVLRPDWSWLEWIR